MFFHSAAPFSSNRCPFAPASTIARPQQPLLRRDHKDRRRFRWMDLYNGYRVIERLHRPLLSITTTHKTATRRKTGEARKRNLLSPFMMDNFTWPTDEYRAFPASSPLPYSQKKRYSFCLNNESAKQWYGYIRIARGRRVNSLALRVFHGYREERRNPP